MNLEVVIRKTLVFAGLLASVFAMLILPTLLIQEYILRGAGTTGRVIGLTISGIIIILTMRHIERFLINVTDRFLYQKKYDYKELLKTFTQDVLSVVDISELSKLTTTKLSEIMKLSSCDMLIFVEEKKSQGYIRKDGGIDIPIAIGDRMLGLLKLGRKKSDEDYTTNDLDILLPLSRTLAIAISNAKLFEELGRTRAQAAQREKMALIGTLAAGMAHEIRNPLTTIRTFADYMPEQYAGSDFIRKFNGLIPHEIDRIEKIVHSLLEFSTSEDSSKKEKIALLEVLNVDLAQWL